MVIKNSSEIVAFARNTYTSTIKKIENILKQVLKNNAP